MSPLACSLLKGILEPDAEKRYTIAEIRSHPWFVPKRFAGAIDLKERGLRISSSSSYGTRSPSCSTTTSPGCSTSCSTSCTGSTRGTGSTTSSDAEESSFRSESSSNGSLS